MFAGVTVTLVAVGFAVNPFLLLLAAPFGLATYLLWRTIQEDLGVRPGRVTAREAAERRRDAERDPFDSLFERGPGPSTDSTFERGADPWADPRADPQSGPRNGDGGADADAGGRRRRKRATGGANRRRARRSAATSPGLSREEAYRALGLAPGADAAEVRRAYREKVKRVHPDADTGDEEAFKRVTRAYEILSD